MHPVSDAPYKVATVAPLDAPDKAYKIQSKMSFLGGCGRSPQKPQEYQCKFWTNENLSGICVTTVRIFLGGSSEGRGQRLWTTHHT